MSRHYQECFDDRLIQAFEYLNENRIMNTDLLVQLWLPVISHGKRVLKTENKLFIINSDNTNLSNYREVSKNHQFSAEYDSTELIGFPSSVFLKKFPTCTPDLQFVSEGNDPRGIYAKKLNLCGCLNLPVFELDGVFVVRRDHKGQTTTNRMIPKRISSISRSICCVKTGNRLSSRRAGA